MPAELAGTLETRRNAAVSAGNTGKDAAIQAADLCQPAETTPTPSACR